jgi:Holliday junction resolvasome RuvABC endonuclease subunit
VILGIDLSLNHAGLVIIDEAGEMIRWGFVTDVKSASQHPGGTLLPKWVGQDPQQLGCSRLRWWRDFLGDFCRRARNEWDVEIVGIEDYAFDAKGHAHATGELGGIARVAALDANCKLRLHDPSSVKMFAAHNGHANGFDVLEAVERRWVGDAFRAACPPAKKDKQNTLPAEDLAAAYTVARLVWTEVQLRAGKMALEDLHEKEIQVFNRVTKATPVNLLGRNWIVGGEQGRAL